MQEGNVHTFTPALKPPTQQHVTRQQERTILHHYLVLTLDNDARSVSCEIRIGLSPLGKGVLTYDVGCRSIAVVLDDVYLSQEWVEFVSFTQSHEDENLRV